MITAYNKDGLRFYDAIDPALFDARRDAARPGTQLADLGPGELVVQAPHAHDRRAGGRRDAVVLGHARHRAELGLRVRRGAHGRRRTTGRRCPTLNGHTSHDTGNSCPFGGWQAIHPFLAHYQTDNGDGTCTSTGTTGAWWAATGPERRLRAVEGRPLGLRREDGRALDRLRQRRRRADPRRVHRRHRSPRPARARPRSRTTATRSTAGRCRARRPAARATRTTAPSAPSPTLPPTLGVRASQASFAREPEIIALPVRAASGRTPSATSAASSIDLAGLGFALENQTRPIYAQEFFYDPIGGGQRRRPRARAPVVRRQRVASRCWQRHLAERGLRDLRRVALERARGTRDAAGDLRRHLRGDSRRRSVLAARRSATRARTGCSTSPVYTRGAMTLQQLRVTVGDDDVLPHPAQVGEHQARRQRLDRRVHQARRAHLRPGSRRALHHLAVHARPSRTCRRPPLHSRVRR